MLCTLNVGVMQLQEPLYSRDDATKGRRNDAVGGALLVYSARAGASSALPHYGKEWQRYSQAMVSLSSFLERLQFAKS